MIDYRVYYAALHTVFRLSQSKLRKLYKEWGTDISQLWEQFDPASMLPLLKGISKDECAALRSSLDIVAFSEKMERGGVKVIFEDDAIFPYILTEVHPSVCILYCTGRLELLSTPSVAVVGARKMSVYARQVIQEWLSVVERVGNTVISGGAVGVDACAHRSAIDLGIPTIAVLGSGIDIGYPASNRQLFRDIIEHSGLVLSEFPMGASPEVFHFPLRNRIIAALAHTTLVIEAKQKSGALVTAKIALELGKEVFATVGNVYEEGRQGGHGLIKRGEATAVVSAEHFGELMGLSVITEQRIVECSDLEAMLLSHCTHVPQEQDILLQKSGLSMQDFQLCLTTLELKSYIQKVEGTKWIRLCSYKTVTQANAI